MPAHVEDAGARRELHDRLQVGEVRLLFVGREPTESLQLAVRLGFGRVVLADRAPPCRDAAFIPVHAVTPHPTVRCSELSLAGLEVRILDDAQPVAERIAHRRDANTLADVLHRFQHGGAELNQPGK